MRTAVSDTSIRAYYAMVEQGTLAPQEARVVATLRREALPLTRREIAKRSGIDLCAVTGRVNKLIADGVLRELPARPCTLSGKSAHPVEIAPRQGEMFA